MHKNVCMIWTTRRTRRGLLPLNFSALVLGQSDNFLVRSRFLWHLSVVSHDAKQFASALIDRVGSHELGLQTDHIMGRIPYLLLRSLILPFVIFWRMGVWKIGKSAVALPVVKWELAVQDLLHLCRNIKVPEKGRSISSPATVSKWVRERKRESLHKDMKVKRALLKRILFWN